MIKITIHLTEHPVEVIDGLWIAARDGKLCYRYREKEKALSRQANRANPKSISIIARKQLSVKR